MGRGSFSVPLCTGPGAHTALPQPFQTAENSPVLWGLFLPNTHAVAYRQHVGFGPGALGTVWLRVVKAQPSQRPGQGEVGCCKEMFMPVPCVGVSRLGGPSCWGGLGKFYGKRPQQLPPTMGFVQVGPGRGPLTTPHCSSTWSHPDKMLQLANGCIFSSSLSTLLNVFFCCPLSIAEDVFPPMHSWPILPSNIQTHLSFPSGLIPSGVS